jgi:flagellar biosynthesis/type III secretory pathway M-ring protein FliF/YscJ
MAIVYFFLWVVFIVAVIAAVPIANALEKKRRREAMPQQPTEEPAEEPVETAEFEQTESEGFGDELPEETAEVTGGDDFSAFDEEFK